MTIDDRWMDFHKANPGVYDELERMCKQWVERWDRPRRVGIEMFFSVIRWERAMLTNDPDPRSDFKLNDHYTSRYARYILARHPEWEGLFELRELRAE